METTQIQSTTIPQRPDNLHLCNTQSQDKHLCQCLHTWCSERTDGADEASTAEFNSNIDGAAWREASGTSTVHSTLLLAKSVTDQ